MDDYRECTECGYQWHGPADDECPSCGVFGKPIDPARAVLIDWPEFWARDPATEDWSIWPLVPAGRGVALYAPAKGGKSLVALALVAWAATGHADLEGTVRPPVEILYLDYEMTLDDLQERLEALGYGPDTDLSHLHYASLPSLPPLNTPEGAKAVLALVEATGAKVVVIDTFGRAVDGEENSNDVARDFYRWTGLALKSIQVGFLRTDHSGKDVTKGMRGGSAKADDVDVVFQLTRVQGGVILKATHRRMGWVPETVQITVDGDEYTGWDFKLTDEPTYPAGTKDVAQLLDELDVPTDASIADANRAIKAVDPAGKGRQKTVVAAAQRFRRATGSDVISSSEMALNGSRNRFIDKASEPLSGTVSSNGHLAGPEPVPEPLEPVPPDPGGQGFHPMGGTTAPVPPFDDDEEPIF